MIRIILFITFVFVALTGEAQGNISLKYSDVIVSYDTVNQHLAPGAVIPFDKHFVLKIPVRKGTQVKEVYIYLTGFKKGKRYLIDNLNSPGGIAIPDMVLSGTIAKDSLVIPFPPIKPSKNFDVVLMKNFTGKGLQQAYELNELLFNNTGSLNTAFSKFQEIKTNTTNDILRVSSFEFDELVDYRLFYSTKLAVFYNRLHDQSSFIFNSLPSMDDINVLESRFRWYRIKFPDINRVVKIINDQFEDAISDGTRTFKYDNVTDATDQNDYLNRINNLDASLLLLDTLSKSVASCLAIEKGDPIKTIGEKIDAFAMGLVINRKHLSDGFKGVNKAISESLFFRDMDALIGTTVAKDIKTRGGNILTFDLGMVNIITRNVRHDIVYIPKPYYGVNIYLRAIDKNTRGKDFPNSYPSNGAPNKLATVNSFRQHFSICLGLTLGALPSAQYDYLLNNSALMIGGGYRIGRFFKINTGLTLLKRSSYNPVVTEKKVIGGFFVSTAIDIDLVQGVKDFTNLIWK